MIRCCDEDGRLLALVIKAGGGQPLGWHGCRFYTDPQEHLQVGFMRHPGGYVIAKHLHAPSVRHISTTTEVLHVVRGRVEVSLYGTWEMSRVELSAGDTIILLAGGHGFRMLEETEIIEIKQGPHQEDDKRYL